jgi:DNA-directed RNA polymerase specialized sigma24 family protein
MVAEQCRLLLARLATDELRTIAVWKMEGYTNDEIAARLDCAPSTVERKLQRIRMRWLEEAAS